MAFREANIVDVESYDELQGVIADGRWARGPWAGVCTSDPKEMVWTSGWKTDKVLQLSLCMLYIKVHL